MAQDPRVFTSFSVKNCPKNNNQRIVEDTKKRDFFDGLGKVGDIEVLNRFGDGKITSGLRTLSKLSDSVRTGETDSAIIPNDAGYVFETIDINTNAAEKAGQFNPGVLNRATGSAEAVIDRVKQGNFKLEDIPSVFSDFQDLSTLVGGVYTDGGTTSVKDLSICGASPYAIDLISYAPKYKFLFIVQVELSPAYQNVFDGTEKNLAFVVKTSTRPNVTIEHEEVNLYNFWTRIPKRTVFEPVTMRFYDDNKGLAHNFYTTYLRNISPITREGGMGDGGILSVPWFEANSMNPNTKGVRSTASVGALSGTNTSIITEIRLFHVFDYGRAMSVYHFHHPKMLSMNLDELDQADGGGGNEIELQFGYDSLHITPSFSVSSTDTSLITALTGGESALYPIVPNFNSTDDGEYDDEDDDTGFGVPEPEPEEAGLMDSVTDGLSSAGSAINTGISSARKAISNAFDTASDFGSSLFK